ncbi:hypothetical protein ACFC36_16210 [Streptomyces rubiginosohelvolus]|uniref:deoxynucleotide monophosphate kinase family protein n=1 Tax=Streptomyces rubiginosohelvolus TaxID=67362 RepID=UPI0035DAE993
MKPTLIGLAGAARSGKDTTASFLVDMGWRRKAFADPIREFLYRMDLWLADGEGGSLPLNATVDERGWEAAKEEHFEVRGLLQRCGTEAGRGLLGPDVWVEALFRSLQPGAPTVISDVRFPNEARAIKERGGLVVQVRRPKQILIDGADHISENALADWDFDATLLNVGTLDDLRRSAECLTRSHPVNL